MDVLSRKLLNLKKSLECPVCIALPESAPIYQCENGHIICKTCRQSLETCPVCRIPLGNDRNLTAESFLEAFLEPCPFVENGCKVKLLPDNQEEHRKSCDFRPVFCPVKKCPQKICFHQVINHLESKHGEYIHVSGKYSKLLTLETDSVNCYSHNNNIFLIMKTITTNGNWHFWVYGLGTPEEMAKFSYEINLYNHDGSSKISTQEKVVSLDKSLEDVVCDKNGLVLTEDAMTKLKSSGPASYTVSIRETYPCSSD